MYSGVIVETRNYNHIRTVITDHYKYLDKDWELVVFHGPNNGHLFLDYKAKLIKLDKDINRSGYNQLVGSKFFWEQIPHDKVLIFQHDSGLLRCGIEEFMEWDYVGAPINHTNVQNGGLSLRTKSVMLDIVNNHTIGHLNEDNFFCNNMKKYGKLAPPQVARKFSCEMIFTLGSLGYHAIDRYLNKHQCNRIRSQYDMGVPELFTSKNTVKDFNEEKYLFDNPDVKKAVDSGSFQTGFEHYEKYGKKEGRKAATYSFEEIYLFDDPGDFKKGFNEFDYLMENPDVRKAVEKGEIEDGYNHYRKFGYFENRIK